MSSNWQDLDILVTDLPFERDPVDELFTTATRSIGVGKSKSVLQLFHSSRVSTRY
jgi:hypothetical protein